MRKPRLPQFIATSAIVLALAAGCSGCKGADENTATKDTTTGSTGSTPSGGGDKSSGGGGRPAVSGPGVDVSGNTIKIGLVASLTGDQKPWGDDSYKGAQLAVDEVNAAGGIDGKKIELDKQDSQSNQTGAKTAAQKLLSDGVVAIVGEVSSGNTEQIGQAAFEKGVADVAIGATKTTLTGIGQNMFRVCYTDDLQGPVMARFAYQERGMRKMATFTDTQQPYSRGLTKSFSDEFKKLGGEIVDEETYETGQSTFTTQLTNMKAKDPQGIFMSGYFPEVGPIAASARDLGIKAEFFGGDGWDSPQILTSGGQAIIGSFFCNHYNDKEDRPIVKDFLKKFAAANNGQPAGTTMGALGYDAMKITLAAVAAAAKANPGKPINSLEIIKQLDATEGFKGVTGDLTLKGHDGNPPKRALVVEIRPKAEGFQVFRKAYEPDSK
jgi:branched-chain amino acid transport system substrate-binding protein